MKRVIATTEKLAYISPMMERIMLDNDISLALDSTPPGGPNEVPTGALAPEYLKNDPFKTNNA